MTGDHYAEISAGWRRLEFEQSTSNIDDAEHFTETARASSPRTLRIRAPNDCPRRFGLGGKVVGTRGFLALDPATQVSASATVRDFDAFTAANDP